MNTILLIEDDKNLNRGITLKLQREGYLVLSAGSLAEAYELWEANTIHLILSDLSLPDGNALDFGRQIREKSDVFLIYLTAMDQEIDIVNGYDAGADDYVTKPFSVNILMSKVNALMRRLKSNDSGFLISQGIEVNTKDMIAKSKERPIQLSRTELMLLIYLMENAGRIVSKEKILERIWGIESDFVDDSTVTVNISRLKNKLGTDAISNVRGLGYLWTGKVTKR